MYTFSLTGKITKWPQQLSTLQTWCELAITHDPTYNNIYIINTGDEDTGTVTITFNPALPVDSPPYVNGVTCSPGKYKRYVDNNNYYYKLTIDNIAPDCQININSLLPLHGTITTQNNCTGAVNF